MSLRPDDLRHLCHTLPADGILRRLHHYAEHRLRTGFTHQNTARIAQTAGHVIHSLLHGRVLTGGSLVVHPHILQHLGIDGQSLGELAHGLLALQHDFH